MLGMSRILMFFFLNIFKLFVTSYFKKQENYEQATLYISFFLPFSGMSQE